MTDLGKEAVVALAVTAGLLGGCAPATDGTLRQSSALGQNRKLDILFMVDRSSSMEPSQANLVRGLPAFMNVLKGLPGGLPDLHIAVVTSDMGAGDGSISGCSGNGDNGVFQASPHAAQGLPACLNTTLQNGATFISDTGGATPQNNFSAVDITTVVQCIAPVGPSGCGFEHQLAAIVRALGADGSLPPPENVGFLRPEADLAIILLTNEDDCSAPVTSLLYDTSSNFLLSSQVGPPANFRCNEFGHLCSLNGAALAKPIRLSPKPADLTTTVTYDNCVSSEQQGMLTPVATFAQEIKALKADPANQIVVASIQGPATPYVERWNTAPTNDTGPWPAIVHSCDGGSVSGFGDPGVRLQQFVQAFGNNGAVFGVCDEDFNPTLTTIATKLGQPHTASPDGGAGGAAGAGGGGASSATGGGSGAVGSGGAGGASGRGGASGAGGSGGSGTGGLGASGRGGANGVGARGGAGAGPDASPDAGLATRDSGCGCGAGGRPGSSWVWTALALVASVAGAAARSGRERV